MVNAAFAALATQPIPLLPNRVWRTYTGGKLIDMWQGNPEPADGSFPEEWVASVVRASNVGREHMRDEGLSRIRLPDATEVTLKDVIDSDPQAFLGSSHVQTYGAHTAVLVKLLDAGERLTIQVHPDRAFARRMFQSEFGKTEAWYMLGGRTISGEQPYVLLGFRPGMTPGKWKDLFERQDISGMMNALHRVPIQEGEVYLIEGGMPHAIGAGCFLIEIQEPTDYTLRVEKVTPRGVVLPDQSCHQGLGFEHMLACFHYDTYTIEEISNRYRIAPSIIQETAAVTWTALIEAKDTDRFRMSRLTVRSNFDYAKEETFAIAIVLQGSGKLLWEAGETEAVQGKMFFLPAALSSMRWVADDGGPLQIVLCHPPQA